MAKVYKLQDEDNRADTQITGIYQKGFKKYEINPNHDVCDTDEEGNKIAPLVVKQGMDVVVADVVEQFQNTGTIYGSSVRRIVRGVNNQEDDWSISPLARERVDKFEASDLARRISKLNKVNKVNKVSAPKKQD